jgi:hypothetical protein
MTDSILLSTKRTLGLADDYEVFDQEIILHINSVLGTTLNQLGIGPDHGFMITGPDETWSEFLGPGPNGVDPEIRYNAVKSYLHMRIRMIWDPPSQGYVVTAWQEMIREMESRLNVMREDIVHPYVPPPPPDLEDVFCDGGTPV